MPTIRRLFAVLLAGALALAACGGDDDDGGSAEGEGDSGDGSTINVPDDHDTIQDAVDAAEPGDLILIQPGTYEESVSVTTDELTIRGVDRNEVILDGGFELDNGIRVTGATGVAIENMTARNYTENGFFWTGVEGYRGSYLTTYRIGDYGIYAFDSVKGLIEHSFTSGSPDAGVYIGQCYPCDAVIDDVVSEHNGLGYSGTNSGGNLLIVNSTFRFNRAGIVPNSGSYELCYPERETTIVGNLVYSNNQADSPAIDVALLGMGNGILPAGGVGNIIERNRVFDHDLTGIGLLPFPEEDANDVVPPASDDDQPCSEAKGEPTADPATIPDTVLWNPRDNRVVGNVIEDSGLADIGLGSLEDVSGLGNCFADNELTSTAPTDLEALAPCEGEGSGGDWTAGALNLSPFLAEKPPSGDYKTSPVPDDQENMPDAEDAPAASRHRRTGRRRRRRDRGAGKAERRLVTPRIVRGGARHRAPGSVWRRGPVDRCRPGRRGARVADAGRSAGAGRAVRRRMSLQPRRPRRPDRALRSSRSVTPAHVLRQHRHRRIDHGCRPGRRRHHLRAEARPGVVLGTGAARARPDGGPHRCGRLLPPGSGC